MNTFILTLGRLARASRGNILIAGMLAMWVLAQVAGPISAQSPATSPAPVATPTVAPVATGRPLTAS